jgi:hypothetical protein
MGFGPPGKKQYHEVCVELKGPVGQKAFEEYKKKMRKCLTELEEMGLKISVSTPRIWHHNPARRRKKGKK